MSVDRGTAPQADDGRDQARRPDASMSMITDLLQERIEDDYLAASRLRVESGHAARPRLSVRIARRSAFFALLAICALFATSGVRQLVDTAPNAADHSALVEEAKDRSAGVRDLERQLVRVRAEYSQAESKALAKDNQSAAKMRRMKHLEDVTGFNAVEGPGVRVVVDDAPSEAIDDQDSAGRILDRDLQLLVNGLWAAGAEAISINGQRLTALTAIREAGDAVLVDYRPLTRPYRVLAVGDPNQLQASFAESAAGRYFKTLQTSVDVRFEMTDRHRMRLPAASTVTLDYARPGENEP